MYFKQFQKIPSQYYLKKKQFLDQVFYYISTNERMAWIVMTTINFIPHNCVKHCTSSYKICYQIQRVNNRVEMLNRSYTQLIRIKIINLKMYGVVKSLTSTSFLFLICCISHDFLSITVFRRVFSRLNFFSMSCSFV